MRSAVPEKRTLGSNTKSIGQPVPEIWPFEIFQDGFGATGNSAIPSADLENPTLESNMKWIGWPVAEIWPFEIFQNARSVSRRIGRSVGRSLVLNIYIVLIHSSSLR